MAPDLTQGAGDPKAYLVIHEDDAGFEMLVRADTGKEFSGLDGFEATPLYPALGNSPVELLQLHDRFMRGAPMTDEEKASADRTALAAAFASEAFLRYPGCDDGATNALLRAFLTALIDPMHPDLDYLRANPEAARAARGAA